MNDRLFKIFQTAKKWIFWSYDRKSWQYDLLCLLLILAIIFIPVKGPQHPIEKKEVNSEETIMSSDKEVEWNSYAIFIKAKDLYLHSRDAIDNALSTIKDMLKDNRIYTYVS